MAPPAQLGAQKVEVVVVQGMEETDGTGMLAHHQLLSRRQAQAGLAVAGDAHVLVIGAAAGVDDDFAVAMDDDGTVAQPVRADGHQHDGVQVRLQQGAASRERVGGGTGGGGDDDAVGTLRVHVVAVHPGLELDHARDVPLVQHHVVESQLPMAVPDAGFQQKALVLDVLALQDRAQGLDHLVRRDVDEEPQPAEIDAHQRDILAHDFAGGVEETAVTAHHDGQVADARQLLLGDGLLLQSERLRSTGRQVHFEAPLQEKHAQ